MLKGILKVVSPELVKTFCKMGHDDEIVMPDKSNTNPAKTPIFTPFLSNSRLKYVQYVGVRLCQKSSKIAAFWLFTSLAPMFLGKTRRVSALILRRITHERNAVLAKTRAQDRGSFYSCLA